MSDMAKQARAAMKAKASKMTTADPHQKVDSSTWTPPEALNADVKTGLRPISRRAFKKGGKVMGEKAKCDLGRKPRKSGGEATQYALAKVNRNVKDANEERSGIKHVGALKTGGRAKRRSGGPLSPEMQNAIEQIGRNPSPSPETMEISPQMQREMRAIMNRDSAASRDYEASEEAKRNYGITGQKRGGKVKKALGGSMVGAKKMLERAQETAGVPSSTLNSVPATSRLSKAAGLKKGGTAKHDDVKQDMALIKKMVKPEARKGRDDGGRLSESTRAAKASRDAYDARKASERAVKDLPKYINSPEFDTKAAQSQSMIDNRKVMRQRATEIGKQTGYGSFSGDPEINSGQDYERLRNSPLIGTYRSNASQTPSAYEEAMKRGGKAKRTARKEGGGVFTGPGYPGKIPGVVPGGREARATGGKTKAKGKTNINIVIAAGKPAGTQDMMGMPPGMDGGPQGLPIPVPPPQGGMPMGGGAPMPMPAPPMPAPGPAPMPRKSGGRLMAKASSYKDMTAGSGGGEGRLQKTDIAKLHKDAPAFKKGGKVYRSYEDMDAGSGSGMGRLEKTEIQKRKS
jgi:hypothetical protein